MFHVSQVCCSGGAGPPLLKTVILVLTSSAKNARQIKWYLQKQIFFFYYFSIWRRVPCAKKTRIFTRLSKLLAIHFVVLFPEKN